MILYYFKESICSYMVRLTLTFAAPKMHVDLRHVDIFEKSEQLDEKFLCEINPKGQVTKQKK
jgi:glutathione S-transferase